MLGKRLLSMHMQDQGAIDKILDFLCSDSGSHDYTLNRREARQDLGLPIETPSEALYPTLIRVYDSFATELELHTPFRPSAILMTRQLPMHFDAPSLKVWMEARMFMLPKARWNGKAQGFSLEA